MPRRAARFWIPVIADLLGRTRSDTRGPRLERSSSEEFGMIVRGVSLFSRFPHICRLEAQNPAGLVSERLEPYGLEVPRGPTINSGPENLEARMEWVKVSAGKSEAAIASGTLCSSSVGWTGEAFGVPLSSTHQLVTLNDQRLGPPRRWRPRQRTGVSTVEIALGINPNRGARLNVGCNLGPQNLHRHIV